MTRHGMVIIGAGEAGARAALELRSQGWNGSIAMIGEEKHFPYERPPLSKECLTKEGEPSPKYILDSDKLSQHNVTLLSGAPVIGIDRTEHSLICADGRRMGYERLLLATGARPRKLLIAGAEAPNVRYLRTFTDALQLRKQLLPGQHIAVIGGGFIGLEVAASAMQRGCSVTLIEAAPRILMRGVPVEIARIVESRHRAAGVVFKIGVGIRRIEPADGKHSIILANGEIIHCDEVIAGIGAVPEISLASGCGLEIDNGIRVNETLQTSDPDIFAAGDCCSFPHILYSGKRIRLEAWRNAQDQGTHVAKTMLGSTEPYSALPWFWSDQYDLTLQVSGLPDCGDKTVNRDLGEVQNMENSLKKPPV